MAYAKNKTINVRNANTINLIFHFLKKTKYGKKYFTSDGKLKKFNSLDDITFEYSLDKYGIKEFRSEILDLLKGMLTINPNSRFTAEKCLLHPFFSKSNE